MLKTAISAAITMLLLNTTSMAAEGDKLFEYQTGAAVRGGVLPVRDGIIVGNLSGKVFSFANHAQRWQVQLPGAITNTPVKYRQLAIVLTSKGVFALNAKTGAIVWQKLLGDLGLETRENWDGLQASPVINDDEVLIAFGDQLLLLDAANGHAQWQQKLPVAISATPTIADDEIYLAGAYGEILQVDLDNGQLQWRQKPAGDMIQGAIAKAGDTLIFASRDGKIRSWSPASNKTNWAVDHNKDWVMAGPLVDKRQVLIGSSDSHMIQAIDVRSGAKNWEIATGQNTYRKAVKNNGRYWFATGPAYSPATPGQLIGVNAKGGAKLNIALPSAALSQPVADDDQVWVGTENGSVFAIATQ